MVLGNEVVCCVVTVILRRGVKFSLDRRIDKISVGFNLFGRVKPVREPTLIS